MKRSTLPDRIPATVLFREIKERGYVREVANARVHATTNAVPAERLVIEQAALQALPAPYRGRSTRSLLTPVRKAVVGYQHPLAVYEDLMPGGAA